MKKIVNFSFLIIICLIMVGCGKGSNMSTEEKMKKIMADNNYIIVDVRTNEEYDNEHVVGAINIPYDEINENIVLDKNKTIMVYCQTGRRSNIAYNNLKNMGYDVLDLGAISTIKLEKE